MNADRAADSGAISWAEVAFSHVDADIFTTPQDLTTAPLAAFTATPEQRRAACGLLESHGIAVHADNGMTLSVAASPVILNRFLTACGVDPVADEDDGPCWRDLAGSSVRAILGGVAVAPRTDADSAACCAAVGVAPFPPSVSYPVLHAPRDLRHLLNADPLHRRGIRGEGVRVTVIDSGCFVSHPFFCELGVEIAVELGPGATNPACDEVGHGTMVCASVASLAPDSRITMLKTPDAASLASFKRAATAADPPAILQNTWGFTQSDRPITPYGRAIWIAVRHAVERGILVVFAGGNEKRLFTAQLPQSLAIGGVHVDQKGTFEAADYASGYPSTLFPGRIVPDFCGLVGMKPQGIYLMMPTQPGSEIDVAFAGGHYPEHDTTAPDDGWVALSGTSSASGQISGICALLRQLHPDLTQEGARTVLSRSARPIVRGVSAEGYPANLPVPSFATGYGLVDADAAADLLKDLGASA